MAYFEEGGLIATFQEPGGWTAKKGTPGFIENNSSNHYVLSSATVDPSGLDLTTGFTFDGVGNLTEVDGPRSDVTDVSDYIWDANRQLTMAIQPGTVDNGTTHPRIAVRTTYDADGQPVQTDKGTTTTATGSDFAPLLTVTTAYDAAGNKIQDTTPTKVIQYAYDADDRLLCTAQRMNPAAFTSLPSSACALGTQGSFGPDRISETIYDAAGQLRQTVHGLGTPVQQVYETFKYSPNGKQIAVADADEVSTIGVANAEALNANAIAAHQTNYVYDGFDRLVETLYADGTGDQITSFDNDNNPLTHMTRAGQTITSSYDVLDRVASKAVPAVGSIPANTTTWAYDLAGKVTSLTDTLGNSLSNSYDLAGRQLGETQTVPGLSAKAVSYQYDQAGNRARLTWPDGYYVTYAYDAANRLTAANENGITPLAAYDYDALGHRATVQYGAAGVGAKVSYSWSTEDDLLTLSHDLAGTANDNAFTDTYTPAHQIAASTISNPAFQYVQPLAGTASYTANGLNEYSSITPVGGSATSIGYDLNGNLTSDGAFVFGYDPENRLMTASKSGTAVAYAYDPLDRRTTKTVNGTATYFVHSGADEIGEYDGSGNLLRRYVPSGSVDEPIAMVSCSGTNCATATKTFFHQDKTDSVVAMSDTSGNLTEGPYTYDAYGNGAPATGIPFKYTGQRLDPETGLYYYRARYYCPSCGRFLQTDPIGYKDDIDWYTYVGEDPTDKEDPTGMTCATDGSSCSFDATVGPVSSNDQKLMNGYLKDMAAALRRLLTGDPNRSVPVSVPGEPSFTITAGEAAQNMINRQLVADPNSTNSSEGGHTDLDANGNPVSTITRSGLEGKDSPGVDPVMDGNSINPEKTYRWNREISSVHEAALHGSAAEKKAIGDINRLKKDANFRKGHGETYNKAGEKLLCGTARSCDSNN